MKTAGRELLGTVPEEPVLITANGKAWVGRVRPEGEPPFRVRAEQARLFAIDEPPTKARNG